MITVWVAVIALIGGLGVGIHLDHESKKAYNKGFNDAMAARILAIDKGEEGYGVTWEEDHHD